MAGTQGRTPPELTDPDGHSAHLRGHWAYLRDYGHVDHGYAATVHKAQGVTVDRAHVLASRFMDRHGAYVGLTRHRAEVSLHYGRDEFADSAALARVLGRERSKDTTLDYGDRGGVEDLVARYAARRELGPRPEAVLRQAANRVASERKAAEQAEVRARRAAKQRRVAEVPPSQPALRAVEPKSLPVAARGPLPSRVPVPPPPPEHVLPTWESRQVDEMREKQARSFVASWDAVLAGYKAALPRLGADPTLGGSRRQLEQLGQALEGRPWLVQMLRESAMDFGVTKEQRPELARVLAAKVPGQATESMLDRVEQAEHVRRLGQAQQVVQTEAQRRQGLGAPPQPGRGPGRSR